MTIQDMVWSYDPKKLDVVNFHDISDFKKGELHEDGKKGHNLLSYHVLLETFYPNNDSTQIELGHIFLEWNYCPECRKIRNKKLIGLEHVSNTAYVREFIRHGEYVADDEYIKRAEQIFSAV